MWLVKTLETSNAKVNERPQQFLQFAAPWFTNYKGMLDRWKMWQNREAFLPLRGRYTLHFPFTYAARKRK